MDVLGLRIATDYAEEAPPIVHSYALKVPSFLIWVSLLAWKTNLSL